MRQTVFFTGITSQVGKQLWPIRLLGSKLPAVKGILKQGLRHTNWCKLNNSKLRWQHHNKNKRTARKHLTSSVRRRISVDPQADNSHKFPKWCINSLQCLQAWSDAQKRIMSNILRSSKTLLCAAYRVKFNIWVSDRGKICQQRESVTCWVTGQLVSACCLELKWQAACRQRRWQDWWWWTARRKKHRGTTHIHNLWWIKWPVVWKPRMFSFHDFHALTSADG